MPWNTIGNIRGPRGYKGEDGIGIEGPKGDPGTTVWADLTGKPATFPPVVGTGSADAKPGDWMPAWSDVKSKPSTFPPTIGSGSTQAVAGNDERLSDARTPKDGSVTFEKFHPDAAAAIDAIGTAANTAVQPGASGSVVVGALPGTGVSGVLYVVP